jgi:hypothetical protein
MVQSSHHECEIAQNEKTLAWDKTPVNCGCNILTQNGKSKQNLLEIIFYLERF